MRSSAAFSLSFFRLHEIMHACTHAAVFFFVAAVAPTTTLGRLLEASRAAAGGDAEVVAADPAWLAEQGVDAWMGPRSLPLWLPFAEYGGFASRTGEAARALGLTHRPLLETLRDTLAWEEVRPADQPRRTGLDDADERALLAAWAQGPGRPARADPDSRVASRSLRPRGTP